jgi:hypothetical protein
MYRLLHVRREQQKSPGGALYKIWPGTFHRSFDIQRSALMFKIECTSKNDKCQNKNLDAAGL